ncbi:hypothetical protein QYM36_017060 [Artemia franciscana]|uniref:Uncharacterized protein n=1 Tax=Artemia franciscana TaxID=6661 RepID=A0AA88H9V6_ARTSF|nr:hypothetical protein QYM36_017060 [Artemia franciscana]
MRLRIVEIVERYSTGQSKEVLDWFSIVWKRIRPTASRVPCSQLVLDANTGTKMRDFFAGTSWHNMRGKGVKPGMLVNHFESNGRKASVDKQGLAFCGKDHEGGNYVELANLLTRHNIEMNQWMSKQNKPHVTSYLSGCSQDELIATVGTELVQKIITEVNEAHFFEVFAEGTLAVSHEERLAVGVRYDDVKGAAKERLLTVVGSESKKRVDFSEEFCKL